MTLRVVLLPLELLLVVNASISEAHNFVDRHLSLQSVEDVLPPPVLHEVDALRTFSDQRSPRESAMKALIRPMKSVAGQELQRGNGIVPVSAAKSRVLIPRVKVL